MRAEELMVGDWVYLFGRPVIVETPKDTEGDIKVNHNGQYEYCDDDFISPIPITPEILEKNGFKKNGGLYLLQGTTYQISLSEIYDGWWNLDVSSLKDGSECYCKTIQHIHQLQHFMRDFEIEKEVSL